MVVVATGAGKGGGGCPDVGIALCCGVTSGLYVWVVDVGYVLVHW